jgi:hypothetical protein
MLLVLLLAGSIFDSHKRRAVQPLMYVRLASLATETGVLGEGLLAALPSQMDKLLPVRGFALSYEVHVERLAHLSVRSVGFCGRAAGWQALRQGRPRCSLGCAGCCQGWVQPG